MTIEEQEREGLDDVGELDDAVVIEVGSILAGQFPAHEHPKERAKRVGEVDLAVTVGVTADENTV